MRLLSLWSTRVSSSVEKLLPIHNAQLLTYMRLRGISAGLLMNFNVELLNRCEPIRHVDSLQPPYSLLRREAEARQIGGDHMEAIGEQRDEVPEHVGRRGEPVEEEDGRRLRIPGLPEEEGDALDRDAAVVDLDGGVGGSAHRGPHGVRLAANDLLAQPRDTVDSCD